MRIIYGINPVIEALRSGTASRIKTIYLNAERHDHLSEEIEATALEKNIAIRRVDKHTLGSVAGSPHHQGVVALVRGEFPYCSLDHLLAIWKGSGEPALILLLDSIEDPVNLGSIIRSAHCAGVHGIVIPRHRACRVTPVVTKSSAGATEHTAIALVTNLRQTARVLKEEGLWVVGIEATGQIPLYDADLTTDVAMVVGGEWKGIGKTLLSECDLTCHIPMRGRLNSLNAAQASTVAIFEALRQRLCR